MIKYDRNADDADNADFHGFFGLNVSELSTVWYKKILIINVL